MSKIIQYGEEAKKSVINGIDAVANIVKTTVGPNGRNVLIKEDGRPPLITNDGVTIAKAVQLKDKSEDAGAQLIISSANKTNEVAGDGPQPLNAKVLTPNGFVEIKDLNVGDIICGTNNTKQQIVGTYRKGIKHQYKVCLNDGSTVLCSGDHLWSVYSYYEHTPKLKTLTLSEILNKGLYKLKKDGSKQAMFYVPVTSVEFENKDVNIDPFLLGVLLGDGCLTNKENIEFGIGYTKISKIINKIHLNDGWYISRYENSDRNYVRFRIKGKDKNNKTIGDYLETLGLIGTKSNTKFIPKIYIYNTIDKRKSLLDGLLSTDGHINKRCLFEFSTVSARLNEDFIELIKSLGIQFHHHIYTDRINSYGSKPIHRISQLNGFKYGNKIVDIKDTFEDVEMMCIKVSNLDQLYITNDYVITHNTTTTTILAQEMIHKYTELVTDEGKTNPVQVQKEMISCANLISDYLKTKATPIENIDDIKRVATISSGSEEIGNLIGNAFEASGEYGSVIVEDSKTGNDGLRTTQGMKLTNGSINQFLFTDRVNRKTDLLDVNILITKDRLDSATDVLPLLDDCAQTGRKLLILCEDCENDIINTIIMNKVRYGANLNISIVRIPGYGDIKDNIIDDICLATGATKMGREFGISIKEYTPKYLGIVDQIVVGLDETILKFTDTGLNNEDLAEARHNRAIELNEQLQNAQDNEKQAFKKRISNLIDGISVIEVGGNSDVEIQDKKLRIEDAINSVLSAKEEGIVTGGGYSFLDVYMNMTVDNSIGSKIVMDSLKAVTKQIAENAGYSGDAVVKDCLEKKLGFNALTGNYENLIETGVINSVKVDRYSVINATSIAATVITMGGNIVEENEKDPNILQLAGPIPEVL